MNCLHIYAGDGKGKTTASIGLALRALGCGKKVVFCQFFKNGTSGEVEALQTFENLTYLKSDTAFPMIFDMTEEQKSLAKTCYLELFEQASQLAKESDMIVFDEIISTYNLGFFDKEYVIETLRKMKEYCEVVTTGRDPSEELCEIANYISDIKSIKHPYDQGLQARLGIEF
ncbi:MAG: cob(I)yrinic acid a,c-diamide adenosyltransferase [Bacillota bacterium]